MDKINIFEKHKWLPKAILFDFEGTLVTFEWKLKKGVAALLSEIQSLGYSMDNTLKDPTYVDIHNFVSDLSETNNNFILKEKTEMIYDKFDADALTRWKLNKGAKRMLSQLKKNNFLIGLVTNVGSRAIISALKNLKIDKYFTILITRNDVNRLKPSPDGLNIAINKLNISLDSVLFIGDSFDDIGAAKNAGIRSCYLKGGQDNIDFKNREKPYIIID